MDKETKQVEPTVTMKKAKPKTVADVLAASEDITNMTKSIDAQLQPTYQLAKQVAGIKQTTTPITASDNIAKMTKGIESQLGAIGRLSKQITTPGTAWKTKELAQPAVISKLSTQRILPRDFHEIEKAIEKIDKESIRHLREKI